jgi:hypothetical protein
MNSAEEATLTDDHHPKAGQCIPEKQQEELSVERPIRQRSQAIAGWRIGTVA